MCTCTPLHTTAFATVFPQVLLTAATFDELLWYGIGAAISDEARAMHDSGVAGLAYWAPNISQ
jgi:beta-glucosidase-like glycosyl hydrolase